MAFIYRYHIKNTKKRNEVNLLDFSEDIIGAIKSFYEENLKDCRVEKDYYEYKLYSNMGNRELRMFGRYLIRRCEGLNAIWEEIRQENTAFFVRKESEYYAFVYRDETEKNISLGVIDATDFNELERLSDQAVNYIKKYHSKFDLYPKHSDNELDINKLSIAFYMDIFDLYINEKNIREKYKSIRDAKLVLIKGYHQRDKRYTSVFVAPDVYRLRAPDGTVMRYDDNLIDGFRIKSIKIVNEEKLNTIIDAINYYIIPASSINNIHREDKKGINFVVHNVGQGLSTALTIDNEPFLYFDFGVSEGKNRFNLPKVMTVDVNRKPSIVISHIHRDHWFGICEFPKAFECDWYIPNQDREVLFIKRCAEIRISGGSISIISSSIQLSFGCVFVNEYSKHNRKRIPTHKHENGLAMRLKLYSSENKEVNILVSGDQRYDYMPDKYLKGIDILVASHHGGEYSWSCRGNVHDDIPDSTRLGKIIYSYGKDNTYEHPSKDCSYHKKGWTNEHRTPIHGDYCLK
ncbi:MBL fold metallo-hydrolase [Tissierella sp.]|uniref:MBL fold metallo-hydrolase n=1 Tax=Tissierella sp. TaxID=41274 RepID=UPI00285FBD07|nr:MBL fold metallo-hydrolase [Tissierella sp.]MDR7856817.1 MBL fold metallo-hydrolase [Tissierella sp.]